MIFEPPVFPVGIGSNSTISLVSSVIKASEYGPLVGVTGTDARITLKGSESTNPASLIAHILNLYVAPKVVSPADVVCSHREGLFSTIASSTG